MLKCDPVRVKQKIKTRLNPASRNAGHYAGKLLQHLQPAELGAPKRLITPRLGDVEARVLQEDARSFAVAGSALDPGRAAVG